MLIRKFDVDEVPRELWEVEVRMMVSHLFRPTNCWAGNRVKNRDRGHKRHWIRHNLQLILAPSSLQRRNR